MEPSISEWAGLLSRGGNNAHGKCSVTGCSWVLTGLAAPLRKRSLWQAYPLAPLQNERYGLNVCVIPPPHHLSQFKPRSYNGLTLIPTPFSSRVQHPP